MEANPCLFFVREIGSRLAAARVEVAAFVGADPDDLAFVPNATSGVNAVLRSLPLAPGDELLMTTHVYNACRNTLDYVAERAGARVVTVTVPFPVAGDDEIAEAVLDGVGPRTRLAMLDHVTSPTGLVFPVARLVAALAERGIDTLIDGAHGPGMVPVDVTAIGAAYYVGHGHKWLCAPKGAAFLHVRRDRQETVRPTVISHGANAVLPGVSRFRLEFDWAGTDDPTPALCLPAAIRFLGGLLPGGWDALRARNRALAVDARRLLCAAVGTAPPSPDALIGALAAVPLPDDPSLPAPTFGVLDPLQVELYERFKIEVLVNAFPAAPRRVMRISAHAYNTLADYERLADALRGTVARDAPAGA
jgi:isopenicillin-N epimerase